MKKMMIIAAMVSMMLIPAQMEANNRVNNKGNLRFWWGTADRKYSRARFRRLRLTIEEILKDLEKTM